MKYKTIKYNGVNIHTIKTDRFKVCLCSVFFLSEAKKENVTKNSMLIELLTDSNMEFQEYYKYRQAQENLYNNHLRAYSYNIANRNNFFFDLKFLNPTFSEKDQLEKNIDFLFDIIYKPLIKNQKFDQTVFAYSKNRIESQINSIYENKQNYAQWRMNNILNDQMPSSFTYYGYINDLKRVNPTNLVNYYQEVLKREMHVFFVGNVDSDEVIKIIKNRISDMIDRPKIKLEPIIQKRKNKIIKTSEEEPNNQAQLVMGFITHNLNWNENNIVMDIIDTMLSGTQNSILFNEIREKKSLCYSIRSRYSSYDNVLSISTSINNKNYKIVVEEVKKIINQLQTGDFSTQLLNEAKKKEITAIQNSRDTINRIFTDYIIKVLIYNNKSIDFIPLIKKVTKADIIKVAKKIDLQVIYFLASGGKNEKI